MTASRGEDIRSRDPTHTINGDNGNEMEMPEDRPRNSIPGGDEFSLLELSENSW